MNATEEQVRISKILSEKGLCSRREADRYIEQGLVLLDGKVVSELGTRAFRSQKVELMKKASSIQASKETVILNKPVGYISHLDDEKEFTPASSLVTPDNFYINSNIRKNSRFNTTGLAPAGRLDIDSSGLLVLTKDGRIAKQIIGENAIIEKEYLVRIDGSLNNASMDLLNHGLTLDDHKLKPAKVFWQNEDQLSFTLIEGRNRQIRRMCELVGVKVVGLKRVRIGNVKLGDIPTKRWRFLNPNENF
ncbi:rRNA pseudouridine synthase [Methylophilaceae bacterium]|jgi:23S rRNA pseudouridine2604 synthase|nr:rRNA pseudouridine synthase [Methylophilaceae bacterium]